MNGLDKTFKLLKSPCILTSQFVKQTLKVTYFQSQNSLSSKYFNNPKFFQTQSPTEITFNPKTDSFLNKISQEWEILASLV